MNTEMDLSVPELLYLLAFINGTQEHGMKDTVASRIALIRGIRALSKIPRDLWSNQVQEWLAAAARKELFDWKIQ